MYSQTNRTARGIFEAIVLETKNLGVVGQKQKRRVEVLIATWDALLPHWPRGDARRDGRDQAWVETYEKIEGLRRLFAGPTKRGTTGEEE